MSDLMDFGMDPSKAAAFNAKYGPKIGWAGRIPEAALKLEPQLRADHTSTTFPEGVHDLQCRLFPGNEDAWDGKLGSGTWRAICEKWIPVEEVEGNYIIFKGNRISLPERSSYQVICYDQPGGLDLHREGDFQKGRSSKKPLQALMWHWGSSSAQGLYNVFENAVFDKKGNIIADKREVSSHGGLELSADGQVRFYQFLDFWHRAWHGGKANSWTVGLDICQQPTEKWYDKLRRRGWDVELVKNPSTPRRGDRKIVTLEPRLAVAARHLTEDICAALGIPLQIPRGDDGLASEGDAFYGTIAEDDWKNGKVTGVVGHFHSSPGKWDIAPWWRQVFPDFH
jgi:hypothetical protein